MRQTEMDRPVDLWQYVFIFTSKMPSIKRTVINAPTPAFAANGVSSVNTDVTAIPMPNTFEQKIQKCNKS